MSTMFQPPNTFQSMVEILYVLLTTHRLCISTDGYSLPWNGITTLELPLTISSPSLTRDLCCFTWLPQKVTVRETCGPRSGRMALKMVNGPLIVSVPLRVNTGSPFLIWLKVTILSGKSFTLPLHSLSLTFTVTRPFLTMNPT